MPFVNCDQTFVKHFCLCIWGYDTGKPIFFMANYHVSCKSWSVFCKSLRVLEVMHSLDSEINYISISPFKHILYIQKSQQKPVVGPIRLKHKAYPNLQFKIGCNLPIRLACICFKFKINVWNCINNIVGTHLGGWHKYIMNSTNFPKYVIGRIIWIINNLLFRWCIGSPWATSMIIWHWDGGVARTISVAMPFWNYEK